MDASTLYQEGRLSEAIASLSADLRDDPTNVQRRTFLFELLCFAGEFDRAQKQLSVLAQENPEASLGILSYRQVVECEATRQEMFASGSLPPIADEVRPVRGVLNGEPFERLEDADPRIGPRLEVFLGGQYSLMPLMHVATLSMEQPKRLRDLLWASITLQGGDALNDADFGGTLLPVMTPLAHRHTDELVRLGRVTEWVDLEGGLEAPVGLKPLLVDGEEFPILEVRELEIHGPSIESN